MTNNSECFNVPKTLIHLPFEPVEKFLIMTMLGFTDPKTCIAECTESELAKATGLSRRTIIRYLKLLHEKQVIKRQQQSVYKINYSRMSSQSEADTGKTAEKKPPNNKNGFIIYQKITIAMT